MKQTLIGVVVLVLLGVGGWYAYSTGALKGPSSTATSTPDGNQTVATVNGKAITAAQLISAENQLAAQAGVSTSTLDASTTAQLRSQALDSLINQEVLGQAAAQAGYTASSTQVDAQLAATKAQLGSDAAYQQALQKQGMTEAELKAQIAQGLAIQAYVEATLHLSTVTASQTEITTLYDQLKAQAAGTTTPPLSQVKDQVKQLVISQKQQQQVAQLVQQLRAQANVQIVQ
jgi:hypothetical protein